MKYKIEFNDGITEISNPDGFEYNYNGNTGLDVGETSTDIDLAVEILLKNTTEGQLKIKKENDTKEIKKSMHILQAAQSQGMLDKILVDESSVEVIITRIK